MKQKVGMIALVATIFGLTLTSFTSKQDETEWKKMNREERIQYMRQTVLPKMRQEFAAFDPVKYERINCKTCHGEGVTNETYKMPNPKLPKLPSTSKGFAVLMEKDTAIMGFMVHTVKPQMAELLGMPPSMKGVEGFGCGNCHLFEK